MFIICKETFLVLLQFKYYFCYMCKISERHFCWFRHQTLWSRYISRFIVVFYSSALIQLEKVSLYHSLVHLDIYSDESFPLVAVYRLNYGPHMAVYCTQAGVQLSRSISRLLAGFLQIYSDGIKLQQFQRSLHSTNSSSF